MSKRTKTNRTKEPVENKEPVEYQEQATADEGINETIWAFPSEGERTCYRMYPRPVMNNGEIQREGVYCHGTEKKKGDVLSSEQDTKEEVTLVDTWLCSPIEVLANTIDEAGNAGKLLKIYRTDIPVSETIIVPKEAITKSYDPPVFSVLARRSVNINESRKKSILFYLKRSVSKVIYTKSRTGWTDDNKAFILPSGTIGEENIMLEADNHAYSSHGEMEDWRDSVGALSAKNPIVQLSIMAGFAGAILKHVGMSGGGLHFFGASGQGKTTLLQAGASVWGHGTRYPKSWNATGNGLEQLALLHNDTLLPLDELTALDASTADSMVYALANGYPKQRARGNNGKVTASITEPWRVMTVSTGENAIAEFIKGINKGKLQKAGQAVRFLDIPATGQKYGCFDDLQNFPTPKDLSEAITDATMMYYGTAGKTFINYLINHTPEIRKRFQEARKRITDTWTSTEEERVIKTFALLLVAGEMAIEAGILPWGKDEPLNATRIGFSLWQRERGLKGSNLSKIHVLRAFSDRTLKEPHLFKDNDTNADGAITYHKIIGWKFSNKRQGDQVEYLLDNEGMKELTNGQIPYKECIDAFDSIGALVCEDGKKKARRTVKGISKPRYFHIIKAQVVYDYLEQNDVSG